MSEIRPVMTVFAGTNGRHLRVKGSIPPNSIKVSKSTNHCSGWWIFIL
ncbi:hypothetical protein [Paenibacillus sp. FSL R5-0519]